MKTASLLVLFVGAAVIGTALLLPVVWSIASHDLLRPGLTFQQCGAIEENTSRLACYDAVLRQTSIGSTRDTPRTTLGEGLADQIEPPGPR
jgi:hypothetical protein